MQTLRFLSAHKMNGSKSSICLMVNFSREFFCYKQTKFDNNYKTIYP